MENNEAITSAPNAQTPLVGAVEATTPKDQSQMVSKEEHEKLQKELEQAKQLQSQADKKTFRLEKEIKKLNRHSKQNLDVETFEVEDEEGKSDLSDDQEKELARRKILSMVFINPEFRKVVENDSTLQTMLEKEPLFVLDEWFDAECALVDAKEYFDKRVSMISKPEEKKITPEEIPMAIPNPPKEAIQSSPKQRDESGMSWDEKIKSDLER